MSSEFSTVIRTIKKRTGTQTTRKVSSERGLYLGDPCYRDMQNPEELNATYPQGAGVRDGDGVVFLPAGSYTVSSYSPAANDTTSAHQFSIIQEGSHPVRMLDSAQFYLGVDAGHLMAAPLEMIKDMETGWDDDSYSPSVNGIPGLAHEELFDACTAYGDGYYPAYPLVDLHHKTVGWIIDTDGVLGPQEDEEDWDAQEEDEDEE